MKKTLTIHIHGMVFHMEEDAYDKLKTYLTNASERFASFENKNERRDNLEARVAALFSEQVSREYPVVDLLLVDRVIEQIGDPEQFTRESRSQSPEGERKTYPTEEPITKRLYRDPRSRFIGGVCSGLAHFFNLDRSLIRILFVLAFLFTSGIVLFVYVVLWIAVPIARTDKQFLEMHGRPVPPGSGPREGAQNRSEPSYRRESYRNTSQNDRSNATYVHEPTKEKNGLVQFLGAVLLVIGLLSLAGLIFGLLTGSKVFALLPGFVPAWEHELPFRFFVTRELLDTLLFSVFLITGVPILLLLYAGSKMLFSYPSNNNAILLTALALWLAGIIIAAGSVAAHVSRFNNQAHIEEMYGPDLSGDTLFLQINSDCALGRFPVRTEINRVKVLDRGSDELWVAEPTLTVQKSRNDRWELVVRKSSRGKNKEVARIQAENVNPGFQFEGDQFIIDPVFEIGDTRRWQEQEVLLTLRVPEGKVIFIDENILPLLTDIHNQDNYWKGDMGNTFWMMGPDGLEKGAESADPATLDD